MYTKIPLRLRPQYAAERRHGSWEPRARFLPESRKRCRTAALRRSCWSCRRFPVESAFTEIHTLCAFSPGRPLREAPSHHLTRGGAYQNFVPSKMPYVRGGKYAARLPGAAVNTTLATKLLVRFFPHRDIVSQSLAVDQANDALTVLNALCRKILSGAKAYPPLCA